MKKRQRVPYGPTLCAQWPDLVGEARSLESTESVSHMWSHAMCTKKERSWAPSQFGASAMAGLRNSSVLDTLPNSRTRESAGRRISKEMLNTAVILEQCGGQRVTEPELLHPSVVEKELGMVIVERWSPTHGGC
ncbi:hypothetical protein MRX96_048901 [Rhipicephalus microplus]